jgi:hypothetical protein
MTTQTTLRTIMTSFETCTTDELLSLNKALCATIKLRNAQKQIAASASFQLGDVVTFRSKRGMDVTMKITGFNRARTSAKGEVVGMPFQTWTVSCTLLKKA